MHMHICICTCHMHMHMCMHMCWSACACARDSIVTPRFSNTMSNKAIYTNISIPTCKISASNEDFNTSTSIKSTVKYTVKYMTPRRLSAVRGCRRGTKLLEDQLDRADPWKLANRRLRYHRQPGLPVAPQSAICEFASSSSPIGDPSTVRFSTTAPTWCAGRRSARSTRSWFLRYSPWPRRQYVDRGAPLQATPWRSIHAAPRLCAPLPAALPEPQSS